MSETNMNNNPAGTIPANDGCLDWDDVVKEDGQEFLILQEGDYDFRVTNFERARHGGSAKLPPCNKAVLTLEVQTEEGIAYARVDLFLHQSVSWKIGSFFRSIGIKEKGEEMKMDWNKIPGARGRAHFRPGSFAGRDGQEHQKNEVTRFLPYDPNRVQPGFTDVSADTDVPF